MKHGFNLCWNFCPNTTLHLLKSPVLREVRVCSQATLLGILEWFHFVRLHPLLLFSLLYLGTWLKKNRVTVFSSVKWKHKCVAEFLWELQRWCPYCCLVPWTVTGVSIGDPTQQSYSWRVSLALVFFFFFFTRRSWQLPRAFLPWFVFYNKKKERERMNKVLGQQTRNSNALRMPCGKQNFRWGTLPRNHDCCKALYFPLKGSLGLERKLAEQKSSKSSRAGHKKRTDYVLLY